MAEGDRREGEAAQVRGPDSDVSRILTWPDREPLPALAASVLVALAIGVGGFLIGKSTGADLGKAEQQGRANGVTKGAKEGGARGYLVGFSKAKKKAYGKAYDRAYRRSYSKAYGDAGLETPKLTSIEVSW